MAIPLVAWRHQRNASYPAADAGCQLPAPGGTGTVMW